MRHIEFFTQTTKNIHRGFTLAEVLITLGIIGVVASLTMPSLIAKYKNIVLVNQLKKSSSEISQAVQKYMYDEGYENLKDSPLAGNANSMKEFVNKYFVVVKDCNQSYSPCFAEVHTAINGVDKIPISGAMCNTVVSLASGASVCFDSAEMAPIVDEDGNEIGSSFKEGSVSIISIELDVNGRKGPNTYGRDLFHIAVNDKGQLLDVDYIKYGYKIDKNYKWIENGSYGQIVADGWEMKY